MNLQTTSKNMRQEPKPVSSSVPTLYQKALEAFILKKYPLAWSTCSSALRLLNTSESTPQPLLRTRLWLLKINLAGSLSVEDSSQTFIESEGQKFELNSKLPGEKLVGFLWRDVVNEVGGVEGEVDGEVVIACILLSVTRQAPKVAREIAESWFLSLPEETCVHLETAAAAQTENDITTDSPTAQILAVYTRVIELYLLHVLAELKDFVSARVFLDSNPYLSSDFKERCTETLRELEIKSKEKAVSSVSKLFSQTFLTNGLSSSDTHVTESAETKGNKDLLAESKKDPSSSRLAVTKTGGESNRPSTSPSPKHVESKLTRSPSSTITHTGAQSPAQQTAVLMRRISDIFLQIFQKASRTQLFVIAFVFTVLGFATRQREKIWVLLKLLSAKTLQTVKMATQITYM